MPNGRHVRISATRVFRDGLPRMQVIGGPDPDNLAYIP
jgi:hypothetical protein